MTKPLAEHILGNISEYFGSKKRYDALYQVFFDEAGHRRLPTTPEFLQGVYGITVDAKKFRWIEIEKLSSQQDYEQYDITHLTYFCDAHGLYFLPTVEWIGAMVDFINECQPELVLEICAGDGFLAQCLSDKFVDIKATDNDHGERAMNIKLGKNVSVQEALTAVKTENPEIVMAHWLPKECDWLQDIILWPSVSFVILTGQMDVGISGGEEAFKYNHEVLEIPGGFGRTDGDLSKLRLQQLCIFGSGHLDHGAYRKKAEAPETDA